MPAKHGEVLWRSHPTSDNDVRGVVRSSCGKHGCPLPSTKLLKRCLFFLAYRCEQNSEVLKQTPLFHLVVDRLCTCATIRHKIKVRLISKRRCSEAYHQYFVIDSTINNFSMARPIWRGHTFSSTRSSSLHLTFQARSINRDQAFDRKAGNSRPGREEVHLVRCITVISHDHSILVNRIMKGCY